MNLAKAHLNWHLACGVGVHPNETELLQSQSWTQRDTHGGTAFENRAIVFASKAAQPAPGRELARQRSSARPISSASRQKRTPIVSPVVSVDVHPQVTEGRWRCAYGDDELASPTTPTVLDLTTSTTALSEWRHRRLLNDRTGPSRSLSAPPTTVGSASRGLASLANG